MTKFLVDEINRWGTEKKFPRIENLIATDDTKYFKYIQVSEINNDLNGI